MAKAEMSVVVRMRWKPLMYLAYLLRWRWLMNQCMVISAEPKG